MTTKHSEQPEPFRFKLLKPFSTFTADGKPAKIPFIVNGLLPSGAISLLAAKPKQGKSSLTRHLAQCVSQGVPFLGRDTEKGEVLIISLEDPLSHVDNHLQILDWDPEKDSAIHIVTRLGDTPADSLQAIELAIKDHPNLKLIVCDTLQKLLQCEDMNDFAKVGPAVLRLHQTVKDNPTVHLIGLIHFKKSIGEDVFDSMLGSTAFRAESATNIAMFENDGRRYIAAETRIGKHIPSTVIHAEVVQLSDDIAADYVKGYQLGETLESNKAAIAERAEQKAKHAIEDRMFSLIQEKGSATHAELTRVTGNMQKKVKTIERLVECGVLLVSGEKGSQANPLTYSINDTMHGIHMIGRNSTEVEVYAA
jgi:hypothetical protein